DRAGRDSGRRDLCAARYLLAARWGRLRTCRGGLVARRRYLLATRRVRLLLLSRRRRRALGARVQDDLCCDQQAGVVGLLAGFLRDAGSAGYLHLVYAQAEARGDVVRRLAREPIAGYTALGDAGADFAT